MYWEAVSDFDGYSLIETAEGAKTTVTRFPLSHPKQTPPTRMQRLAMRMQRPSASSDDPEKSEIGSRNDFAGSAEGPKEVLR